MYKKACFANLNQLFFFLCVCVFFFAVLVAVAVVVAYELPIVETMQL